MKQDWAARRVAKALAGQYVSLSPKIMAELLREERAACIRRCKSVVLPSCYPDTPTLSVVYKDAVADCIQAVRDGAEDK
jgi:hypothetical protein